MKHQNLTALNLHNVYQSQVPYRAPFGRNPQMGLKFKAVQKLWVLGAQRCSRFMVKYGKTAWALSG